MFAFNCKWTIDSLVDLLLSPEKRPCPPLILTENVVNLGEQVVQGEAKQLASVQVATPSSSSASQRFKRSTVAQDERSFFICSPPLGKSQPNGKLLNACLELSSRKPAPGESDWNLGLYVNLPLLSEEKVKLKYSFSLALGNGPQIVAKEEMTEMIDRAGAYGWSKFISWSDLQAAILSQVASGQSNPSTQLTVKACLRLYHPLESPIQCIPLCGIETVHLRSKLESPLKSMAHRWTIEQFSGQASQSFTSRSFSTAAKDTLQFSLAWIFNENEKTYAVSFTSLNHQATVNNQWTIYYRISLLGASEETAITIGGQTEINSKVNLPLISQAELLNPFTGSLTGEHLTVFCEVAVRGTEVPSANGPSVPPVGKLSKSLSQSMSSLSLQSVGFPPKDGREPFGRVMSPQRIPQPQQMNPGKLGNPKQYAQNPKFTPKRTYFNGNQRPPPSGPMPPKSEGTAPFPSSLRPKQQAPAGAKGQPSNLSKHSSVSMDKLIYFESPQLRPHPQAVTVAQASLPHKAGLPHPRQPKVGSSHNQPKPQAPERTLGAPQEIKNVFKTATTSAKYTIYHEWQIDHFRSLHAPKMERLDSNLFFAEQDPGSQFYLTLHPNGVDDETRSHVSVNLHLESTNHRELSLEWRLWFTGPRGQAQFKQKTGKLSKNQSFNRPKYVARHYLLNPKHGFLPNDRFTLCCEVIVFETPLSK